MKYNYKIYRITKTPVSISLDLYDEQNRMNIVIQFFDRSYGMKQYRAIINHLNYQAKMSDNVNACAIIAGFENRKAELNQLRPCPFLEPCENICTLENKTCDKCSKHYHE